MAVKSIISFISQKYTIDDKDKLSLKIVLMRVIFLGTSFFFLFLAQLAYLGMISQIYNQLQYKYLGNLSVFVIYASLGSGSFVAPSIAMKYSPKWILFVSSIVTVIEILSGAFVSACADGEFSLFLCNKVSIYFLVIIITMVSGFFSALIWCAQSKFLDFYSSMHPEKEGLLIGIFWGIFQMCQGFGALITFIILSYFSNTKFFLFNAFFASISTVCFFFLNDIPEHISKQMNLSMPKLSQDTFLMDQELPNPGEEWQLNEEQSEQNFPTNGQRSDKKIILQAKLIEPQKQKNGILPKFKKLLVSKKMRPYLSFFFMEGMIIAFYSTVLYTIIQESLGYSSNSSTLDDSQKQDVNVKSAYVFSVLGFSEVFAAFSSTWLLDNLDFKKVIVKVNTLVQLAIIFTLLANFLENYLLCFVSAVFWGFSDMMYMSLGCYICQVQFQGKLESFCIFRMVQGLGVMFTVAVSILMDSLNPYFFILVILFFQITQGQIILSIFETHSIQQQLQLQADELSDHKSQLSS